MPAEFRDASGKRVSVTAATPLPVTGGGGGGSGTEYTEDAAAVANPVGGMKMARRRDTLTAAEVSADGDVIAVNATAKGEQYVKDTDVAAAITSTAVVTNAKNAPSTTAVLAVQFPVVAKYVSIAASSSGDNVILAAVASKKIRVLALSLMANGAVNAVFQDNATTTNRGGMAYMPAAGYGKVLPFNPNGWFETGAGVGLDLNLSAAVAVGGELVYEEV